MLVQSMVSVFSCRSDILRHRCSDKRSQVHRMNQMWTVARQWKTKTQSQPMFHRSRTPSLFVPRVCPNATRMGAYCNISATPCDILQPCQNNATCTNTGYCFTLGYACQCPPGVNGTLCELDYRPCQPLTCWNNGQCERSSQSHTFSRFHLL